MSIDSSPQLFIGFAAEDRHTIVEPIVYHLKNYGIEIWYDRYDLLLGDDRQDKNLTEGAAKCKYACLIVSEHTAASVCAMEEFSIIEERLRRDDVTVFPILYEIIPANIPDKLQWIKKIIFKEADRGSGTREICNHIACKISDDILAKYRYKTVKDIINMAPPALPSVSFAILSSYEGVDYSNLNSRVSLLYAAYLSVIHTKVLSLDSTIHMVSKIFERLFSETRLNLTVDYRELWLLENSMCILLNCYLATCIESRI